MEVAEGKKSLHRVIVQKSGLRDLKEHPKKVMTTKMCKPEKKKTFDNFIILHNKEQKLCTLHVVEIE